MDEVKSVKIFPLKSFAIYGVLIYIHTDVMYYTSITDFRYFIC